MKHKTIFNKDYIIDNDKRYYMEMIIIPIVLGMFATLMTIMNIYKDYKTLYIATVLFAIVMFIIALANYFSEKVTMLTELAFFVSCVTIYAFFIITGLPDGVSVIWMCLFASFCYLLFGLKKGLIYSGIMFCMLVFFFWIPLGNNLIVGIDLYSVTMLDRFPFIYIASSMLGLFFEVVRKETNDKLVSLKRKFEKMSYTDQLTNCPNRYALKNWMSAYTKDSAINVGFLIIDIDDFKSVNDKYGHIFGDKVLIQISNMLRKFDSNMKVCRWGGEEFCCIFSGICIEDVKRKAEEIRLAIYDTQFTEGKTVAHITVSIGVSYCDSWKNNYEDIMVYNADLALYKSKENHKNQVVIYTPQLRKEKEIENY